MLLPFMEKERSLTSFIKKNWTLLAVLLYVLSPLDFLPEIILPGIGIADDAVVVFIEMYRRWREYKG
jgi:uncharacterized membrane protein YkvA (DUF1232 family)